MNKLAERTGKDVVTRPTMRVGILYRPDYVITPAEVFWLKSLEQQVDLDIVPIFLPTMVDSEDHAVSWSKQDYGARSASGRGSDFAGRVGHLIFNANEFTPAEASWASVICKADVIMPVTSEESWTALQEKQASEFTSLLVNRRSQIYKESAQRKLLSSLSSFPDTKLLTSEEKSTPES